MQQPNGDVVVNTYDFANQLTNTQLDMAPISGPSGATGPSYDAYSYDPAGNQTDHYDADGRHTTTTYDGDNRLQQTVDTTSTGTITTTPQYDPDSNVLTQTMQTVDLTQPGVQQTHTLTNTYNAADWLTSTGDDGLVSSYQYDAAGQPRSETILNGQAPVTTVLDPEGRATAIGENLGGTGPYSSTFAYNQDDLPLTVTLHSDTPSAQVQQVAQYDANSELTHLTASGPSGVANPLTNRYDYAYNAGWRKAG